MAKFFFILYLSKILYHNTKSEISIENISCKVSIYIY